MREDPLEWEKPKPLDLCEVRLWEEKIVRPAPPLLQLFGGDVKEEIEDAGDATEAEDIKEAPGVVENAEGMLEMVTASVCGTVIVAVAEVVERRLPVGLSTVQETVGPGADALRGR